MTGTLLVQSFKALYEEQHKKSNIVTHHTGKVEINKNIQNSLKPE